MHSSSQAPPCEHACCSLLRAQPVGAGRPSAGAVHGPGGLTGWVAAGPLHYPESPRLPGRRHGGRWGCEGRERERPRARGAARGRGVQRPQRRPSAANTGQTPLATRPPSNGSPLRPFDQSRRGYPRPESSRLHSLPVRVVPTCKFTRSESCRLPAMPSGSSRRSACARPGHRAGRLGSTPRSCHSGTGGPGL